MITEIKAQNIKGLTFTQRIGRLTLILGPNGAGKSARRDALLLALIGYVPGTAKKTNQEIFASYSSSPEKLVVGFTMDDGYTFERGFIKKANSITQAYQVQGARASKEFFYETLGKSGGMKAVDVGAFMELSDQKKIDMVLDLYPPAESLAGVLELAAKEKVKYLGFEDTARAKEAAAAELIASKAALNLPPGTLAEIAGEIIRAEAQLSLAQEKLTAATAEQAAAEATLKANAEGKKKQDELIKKHEAAAAEKDKAALGSFLKGTGNGPKPAEAPLTGDKIAEIEASSQAVLVPASEFSDEKLLELQKELYREAVETSFKSILEAFKAAGCTACAARLVVLREFKKYKREV
jgi:energy-coupling factor transporter ATP-binding protein EcfA2